MNSNPCYKCSKRSSTCHDNCKDYNVWVKKYRERKNSAKLSKADYLAIEYIIKCKKINTRNRKRGKHHYWHTEY